MRVLRFCRLGLVAAFTALSASLAVAATATWNVDNNGDWTVAGNWTGGGPPSAAGEIAHLNFNITANRVVTLDADQTIGILNISDPTPTGSDYFSYTISGSNKLIFSNTTGAEINKTQNYANINLTGANPNNGLNPNTAHDVIDVPIELQSNLTIRNNANNFDGTLEFSQEIGNNGTNKNVIVRGPNLGGSTPGNQGGKALVIFSTANTYGGTTTIENGGRLQIRDGGALGTGAIAQIAGGGSPNSTSSLELFGGITVNNNITSISGTESNLDTVGRLENVSGHNIFAGNIQTVGSGGTSYPILSHGTLPGDFFTFSGNIINNRGTEDVDRILRFGGDGNGEVTGNILQTGTGSPQSRFAVYKANAGTWTLSGDNAYTGFTTVNAGTLLVNGTHSGGGAYSVANTATLGGDGDITLAINQSVTVAAGGKLSPGDLSVPGELTFTFSGMGGLDLSAANNDTGALIFGLDTELASDKVILTAGTLNIGTLDFEDFAFTPLGGFGPGTYVLFETNASIAGTLVNDSGEIDDLAATLSIVAGGGGESIVLTVVPEPSSLSIIVIGTIGMGFLRAKRRK